MAQFQCCCWLLGCERKRDLRSVGEHSRLVEDEDEEEDETSGQVNLSASSLGFNGLQRASMGFEGSTQETRERLRD